MEDGEVAAAASFTSKPRRQHRMNRRRKRSVLDRRSAIAHSLDKNTLREMRELGEKRIMVRSYVSERRPFIRIYSHDVHSPSASTRHPRPRVSRSTFVHKNYAEIIIRKNIVRDSYSYISGHISSTNEMLIAQWSC